MTHYFTPGVLAFLIGMTSKKLLKEPLGTPSNIKGDKCISSQWSKHIRGTVLRRCRILIQNVRKNGYEKEMKRNNLATEALVKAKEVFYEEEVKKKDKLHELRQDIADANQDIEQTNKALDRLRDFQSVTQSYKEPKIEDFYSPSPNMRKYQKISWGWNIGEQTNMRL